MNITVAGLTVTRQAQTVLKNMISTCHPGRLSAC